MPAGDKQKRHGSVLAFLTMSWETIEGWPGGDGHAGGPFRNAKEPIVAARVGLSWAERARLYWMSSPEHPYKSSVKRALMTPGFLYVETLSGDQRRVSHDAFAGERREGGFHVYGVRDGQDIRLLTRRDCSLERALQERHQGAAVEAWSGRGPLYWGQVAVFFLLVAVTVGLLDLYPPDSIFDLLERGYLTAETALGGYAWLATGLLTVLSFLLLPSYVRVDSLGVERVRGVLPLFRFFLPREEVTAVRVHEYRYSDDQGGTAGFGFDVVLEFDEAKHLGSLLSSNSVRVKRHPHKLTKDKRPSASTRSYALRDQLAVLLGVSLNDLLAERQNEEASQWSEARNRKGDDAGLWSFLCGAIVFSGAISCMRLVAYAVGALYRHLDADVIFGSTLSVDLICLVPASLGGGWCGRRLCQRMDERLRAHESEDSLRVNLQTATREELEALPMIGAWRSSQIVSHREVHPFRSVDELDDVHGVGEGIIRALQGLVTVDQPTHVPVVNARSDLNTHLLRTLFIGVAYMIVIRVLLTHTGVVISCLCALLFFGCFIWFSKVAVLPKVPTALDSNARPHFIGLVLMGLLAILTLDNVMGALTMLRFIF